MTNTMLGMVFVYACVYICRVFNLSKAVLFNPELSQTNFY